MNIAEELTITGYHHNPDGSVAGPIYSRPISARENFFRFFGKGEKPMWSPLNADISYIGPKFILDNVARAFITDVVRFDANKEGGGKDSFGVEWKYEPAVRGSMVVPGNPTIKDIENWRDVVHVIDPDTLDWEGESEKLKGLYTTDRVNLYTQFTGMFERLISLMDMTNAMMALIDEDEQPYVHEIFDYITCYYEKLIPKLKKYFNVDILLFHDDWGSQRAPFFSPATCREMILPYMKRVVDCAHAHGMIFYLHSCGKNEMLVPVMIEAGIDMWDGQNLNDWTMLAEKYAGQIKFAIHGNKFNPKDYTVESFVEYQSEMYKQYGKYEACWYEGVRFPIGESGEKTNYALYELSRKQYAE